MMQSEIRYIDRLSKKEEIEKVYGESFLRFLYESKGVAGLLSRLVLPLSAKFPLMSYLYGCVQKSRFSRPEIGRFIKKFQVDVSEFQDPIEAFASFNDF